MPDVLMTMARLAFGDSGLSEDQKAELQALLNEGRTRQRERGWYDARVGIKSAVAGAGEAGRAGRGRGAPCIARGHFIGFRKAANEINI